MPSQRSLLARSGLAIGAALAVGLAACAQEEQRETDETTANLISSSVAAPSGGQGLAAPSRPVPLEDLGYTMGDPAAPVQLVEFSDFGCGYCRKFHEEIWPTLEEEYVETGKVYWKYVPMILGIFPNAEEAAQAGECAAEQGRFREMQDRLFRDQSVWKNSNQAEADLTAMAEELGLDMPRWSQCVESGMRDDRIASGTRISQQAGVRGTPTFFVIGYAPLPGALPLELFREVLDTAHAAAMRGEGPATGG